MKKGQGHLPDSVRWENGRLVILDQTELPIKVEYKELTSLVEVWEAIRQLKVRGAPAIGIAAGYGICLAMLNSQAGSYAEFWAEFQKNAAYLASSRPTAVNLFWALERMGKKVQEMKGEAISEIKRGLLAEADRIKEENDDLCRSIAENGFPLIKECTGVLTHCNAGPIATASQYGTALGPLILAHEHGIPVKVYADETRPLNQGSRLTAWELQQIGVDVTLICDNMAAAVMAQGRIQAVLVGCDRVAGNGDVANKIGTYGVAILAKEHGIPFYVAGPTSSFDFSAQSGADIVIEERNPDEITCGFGKRTAPEGIGVYNPAFDVTPAKYVTAIITEAGVIRPPFTDSLRALAKKVSDSSQGK